MTMRTPTRLDIARMRNIIHLSSSGFAYAVILTVIAQTVGISGYVTGGFEGKMPHTVVVWFLTMAIFMMLYVSVRPILMKDYPSFILKGIEPRLLPMFTMGVGMAVVMIADESAGALFFFGVTGVVATMFAGTTTRHRIHPAVIEWINKTDQQKRDSVTMEVEQGATMLSSGDVVPVSTLLTGGRSGYQLLISDPFLVLSDAHDYPTFGMSIRVTSVEDLEGASDGNLSDYDEVRDFATWLIFSETCAILADTPEMKSAELELALASL